MPVFLNQLALDCAAAEAFAFLSVPKHRLQLTPPDWVLEWCDGPAEAAVGLRTTWKLRRFGLSQTSVLETTVYEPPRRLVDEQRRGPFRHWRHEMTIDSAPRGIVVSDTIHYEPPGGILGLLATAAKIDGWLKESFAWRDRQLRLILEPATQ